MPHPSTIRDKEAFPTGSLVPVPEGAKQDEGDILGVDGVAALRLDRDHVERALAAFAVLAALGQVRLQVFVRGLEPPCPELEVAFAGLLELLERLLGDVPLRVA
jgi:hypothetical protein